jgi:pectate lyase
MMYTQAFLVVILAGTCALAHVGLEPRAATNTNLQTNFPKPSATTDLAAARTIGAGEAFDGGMKQYDRNRKICSH